MLALRLTAPNNPLGKQSMSSRQSHGTSCEMVYQILTDKYVPIILIYDQEGSLTIKESAKHNPISYHKVFYQILIHPLIIYLPINSSLSLLSYSNPYFD